jgi:hypothetical protein
MTLTQLAAFITSKLSDTDSASVTACKSYINRRYQMIWDSALWTETLGISSDSVSANATSVTLSTAPSITFYQSASVPTTFIDFPVAVKFTKSTDTDGVELVGRDWVQFFQIDPNMWNDVSTRRATPTNWIPLPKDGTGYFRLKLNPTPDYAGTLYTLGKLKWVELGDSDSPCLRGIDNALLAYAEADMLERARQYGKAQSKFTEAGAMVEIMKDLERGQQQLSSVITPSDIGDNTADQLY